MGRVAGGQMQHLLFEFVVRAALIAAGTAAVLRILRVKMAAARHSAWAGVVVLMLLLPVWTAWGPKASWRVLPAAAAPVSAGRVMLPAEALSDPALPRLDAVPAPVAPASPELVERFDRHLFPRSLRAAGAFGCWNHTRADAGPAGRESRRQTYQWFVLRAGDCGLADSYGDFAGMLAAMAAGAA